MDPPADYSRYGQSLVPRTGEMPGHWSPFRYQGDKAFPLRETGFKPYRDTPVPRDHGGGGKYRDIDGYPQRATSPSWDKGQRLPLVRTPDPYRGDGFRENEGNRYHQDNKHPISEDRGTFFPPGGFQQPIKPSPYKYGDQYGQSVAPDRKEPYQESFRGRYLGKTRPGSVSSMGSEEGAKYAYRNNGYHFYNEPERRSIVSSISGKPAYRFDIAHRNDAHLNGNPKWHKKLDDGKYMKDDDSMNGKLEKRSSHLGFKILIRLFTCCLIFWDLANDWVVGASGPSPFVQRELLDNNGKCTENDQLFSYLNISMDNVRTSICSNAVDTWTALTVFMFLGSVITIIQVINIIMDIISIVRRKKFFRILTGQSELCLAIYVEEIPQAVIMIVLLFHCHCPSSKVDINLFALLASISAFSSSIFRLCTSYNQMTQNDGCCNQWWRCCCCRNSEYCCEVRAKEFFCACDIPFPLCCCTLRCKNCKCFPVTWCNFILKTFGCYCDCCNDKDTEYGIRMVNLFGISLLVLSLGLQIFVFVV